MIASLGIGRKFQKPTVFEQLTVFENLELALKTHKGVRSSMFFRLDSAQSDRLAEVLHTIHLAGSVTRMAGNLGFDAWLVRDATWTFDWVGPDGDVHRAEDIHAMTLANLNGEFARIVLASEAVAALRGV